MSRYITSLRKNCVNTYDITAQFPGMRKPQEFTVYPKGNQSGGEHCRIIQSDTRIGVINLKDGVVALSPPKQGGAYGIHLAEAVQNKHRLGIVDLSLIWEQDGYRA